MDQTQAAPETHITYYGGKWVAFAPILLAIVGLIYIAVKQADVPEYLSLIHISRSSRWYSTPSTS